jgi:hypothetical protein
MSGTGTTTVTASGRLALSGSGGTGDKILTGRTFNHAGAGANTSTWIGTGRLQLNSGATFTNSGVLEVQGDGSVTTSGAAGTFTNSGTFRRKGIATGHEQRER